MEASKLWLVKRLLTYFWLQILSQFLAKLVEHIQINHIPGRETAFRRGPSFFTKVVVWVISEISFGV